MTNSLTDDQTQRLVDSLFDWANRLEQSGNDGNLQVFGRSPSELAQAVKDRTPVGRQFLHMVSKVLQTGLPMRLPTGESVVEPVSLDEFLNHLAKEGTQ